MLHYETLDVYQVSIQFVKPMELAFAAPSTESTVAYYAVPRSLSAVAVTLLHGRLA